MKLLIRILAMLCLACPTFADTAKVLILHTNDLHDHLRADVDGTGGMAYVAGYIRSVKADRDDVLALDGGDVMEKGDIVAFRTKSAMMYEAMNRAMVDAGAPGNHDDAYGLDVIESYDDMTPDLDILCINWFGDDGELLFPASKVYDRGGMRIGVIGMARPRDDQSLDDEGSAQAVAKEAERLDETCHLVVVTCHASRKFCEYMSAIAPKVDVFVSGHSHEALESPVVVEETGAVIVQAGSYAEYVGRIEVEVDLESEAFEVTEGRLIAMDHAKIEPDTWMVAWIAEKEAELAPEADEFVFENTEPIGYMHLGVLAAAAYREAAGADIGFCHAGQVIRDSLSEGPANMNAIFRTGGQRGHDVVRAKISGDEINTYLNTLTRKGWGMTQWSGFKADRREVDGVRQYVSDLNPKAYYDVVMSLKEWDTRFMRCFDRDFTPRDDAQAARIAALKAEPSDVTFTSAVAAYIKARPEVHSTLKEHIIDLDKASELD